MKMYVLYSVTYREYGKELVKEVSLPLELFYHENSARKCANVRENHYHKRREEGSFLHRDITRFHYQKMETIDSYKENDDNEQPCKECR